MLNNKPFFYVMIIFFIIIPTKVFAVNGYKNLMFGMNIQQVLNTNICSLHKQPINITGVTYYFCTDFVFANKTVYAAAFFVDNKLLRFAFSPPVDMTQTLTSKLIKKYGSTSSSSSAEEFNAVDKYPNRSAFLAFDHDTVFLKVQSNKFGKENIYLIYTSPEYDKILKQAQSKSIGNDI